MQQICIKSEAMQNDGKFKNKMWESSTLMQYAHV